MPTANDVITFPVVWRIDETPPTPPLIAPDVALMSAGGTWLNDTPIEIWATEPTAAQVADERPSQGGVAILICRVNHAGELAACSIFSESSLEAGNAAAKLSRLYRVNSQVGEHASKGTAVVFKVDFGG